MENECQECASLEDEKANLESQVYDLEDQIKKLQDEREDLFAKLAAKNDPVVRVAAKQIAVYDRWLFVIDGAGTLWTANVFAAVEGYGQKLEWTKVKLPEVVNG